MKECIIKPWASSYIAQRLKPSVGTPREYFDTLWQDVLSTSPLEYVGACAGVVSVWYARRNNIGLYPTGIVNVVIYVYLCYQARLYADMSINLYYFFMSIYGWCNWRRIQKKAMPTVSYASLPVRMAAIGMCVGAFFILYAALQYTDTDVPAWDASSTALAVVAMWLMTEKKIESWMFWIASDLIAIPLYAYKGYLISTLQYAIFVVFAVGGLIYWTRLVKRATSASCGQKSA